MQLDESKVNESRLLAALGFEKTVFDTYTFQTQPVTDRIALARGIIQGVFDRGDWIYALKLTYETSPIAHLFDGNHDEIVSWAITSAQQEDKVYFHKELEHVFSKHWTGDQIVLFLTSTPLHYQDTEYRLWFDNYKEKFTDEQKKHIHTLMGESALSDENYGEACNFFKKAEKPERIKEIQEKLIENRNPENALQVLHLVTNYPAEKQLVEKLVRNILVRGTIEELAEVYDLERKYELTLPSDEKEKIAKARLQQMQKWQVEKEDPAVQLAWAKIHREEPELAYDIMRKQNYQGIERVHAVKEIIAGRNFGVSSLEHVLGMFERDEVYAVFNEVPIVHQSKIARFFGDKEKLKEVSKKYASHASEKKEILTAYNLWIDGEGAADDVFVKELREDLYKEYNNAMCWLNNKDVFGKVEAYYRVIDTNPKSAYELALSIPNNALLEYARQKFVQQSPEKAWREFHRSDKDKEGRELAEKLLSEKYHLPFDKVSDLLKNKFIHHA